MQENLKPLDLTHLTPDMQGKWVAIDEESMEVIAVAATPKEALSQAQAKGIENPILHKVMPFDRRFISTTTN